MPCIEFECTTWLEFNRITDIVSQAFEKRYTFRLLADRVFYITCWAYLDWELLASVTILFFGLDSQTTTKIEDDFLLLTIKSKQTNTLMRTSFKLF